MNAPFSLNNTNDDDDNDIDDDDDESENDNDDENENENDNDDDDDKFSSEIPSVDSWDTMNEKQRDKAILSIVIDILRNVAKPTRASSIFATFARVTRVSVCVKYECFVLSYSFSQTSLFLISLSIDNIFESNWRWKSDRFSKQTFGFVYCRENRFER
jgi:hypothetical protein